MQFKFKNYSVTEDRCSVDGIEFTSYGITNGDVTFNDVSTDRKSVEEMVERINREQLEDCHLVFFVSDELDK